MCDFALDPVSFRSGTRCPYSSHQGMPNVINPAPLVSFYRPGTPCGIIVRWETVWAAVFEDRFLARRQADAGLRGRQGA